MAVTGPYKGLFNTGHFQRRTSNTTIRPAQPRGPRILIVDEPHLAQYGVYFVEYPNQEMNADVFNGAAIVSNPQDADIALIVVDQPHLAAIHVMREHFPG